MEHLKCHQTHLSNPYCYRPEIEKELLSSLPVEVLRGTHPTKVVRTAVNILKLNLLQCSLLSWLLRRSHSSLIDPTYSANNISIFQEDQDKNLLLRILLNAYHVKSYLNKTTSPHIDSEVLTLIPQFAKIYSLWRPDTLLKDASLAELNNTFSQWSMPAKKSKPDYNRLVNRIIDLSKTYNVAGNEQEVPKKKVKVNEYEQQAKPKKVQVFQEEHSEQDKDYMNKSNSMMLRSSRMNRNPQNFANINFYEEEQEEGFMNNNSLRRSSRLKNNRPFYFDLEHSLGGPIEFPSQPLNNTFLRSTFRVKNDPNTGRVQFSNMRRTVSSDIFKE